VPPFLTRRTEKNKKETENEERVTRCYIDPVPAVAGRLTEVDEVLIGFFESSDCRFTVTANFRSLTGPT
jgi:hypothetical protein